MLLTPTMAQQLPSASRCRMYLSSSCRSASGSIFTIRRCPARQTGWSHPFLHPGPASAALWSSWQSCDLLLSYSWRESMISALGPSGVVSRVLQVTPPTLGRSLLPLPRPAAARGSNPFLLSSNAPFSMTSTSLLLHIHGRLLDMAYRYPSHARASQARPSSPRRFQDCTLAHAAKPPPPPGRRGLPMLTDCGFQGPERSWTPSDRRALLNLRTTCLRTFNEHWLRPKDDSARSLLEPRPGLLRAWQSIARFNSSGKSASGAQAGGFAP